jgi:hypothetical protein
MLVINFGNGLKTSTTCLPMPLVLTWKIEFHVHVDASNFGFRVMLSQNLDNIMDRPIILCKQAYE